MLKRVALVLCCSGIISCCFAQSLTSSPNKAKPVDVFSVAGKPVTADEFIYLYKKNHQHKPEEFTREKIDEYLTLFVNFKLKVQEAKRRGMDTTAAFIKEFNSYRDELRKPYLPDNGLTDSLARLTYQRLKEEINVAHILINVKPDASPADTLTAFTRATDIRNKILAGEDFSLAALQYSDDPSAKSNHGNLGYFSALQMVYPFETAAYNTPVGQVSHPTRTRFGYHLLKVLDRRPAQGEVEVSHIMIRAGEGIDNVKAKNTIFTVYDELVAGVKWEELCKQYSEDQATKDGGGKLRPFGSGGMPAVPEFERIAFQLRKDGEFSDPFQTQFGWHILRLEKRIPLASFEAMEATLKSKVSRDERTTLSKQALSEKLRKTYSFQENQPVKTKVLERADTMLTKAQWKPAPFPNAAKEVLFSIQQTHYYVADFLTYAQKNQKVNSLKPAQYLGQLYNSFVEERILEKVEAKIMVENPTYRYLLMEYYEGILLFEIMEKEVWNKASADSAGQRTYFQGHQADYQAGERASAAIYAAPAEQTLSRLKEIIAAGDQRKVSDYVQANRVKVETGFYKKDEKDVFNKVPWAEGIYATENKGMYYLAWLKEILPPGRMSFEEARPAIISDYQSFLEKKWLEQLKKKYSVKVNEKGKQYVIQQLQSK